MAGKLTVVERSRLAGQKPFPPSFYDDLNTTDTRFGAPAPASELWAPLKTVDA